MLTRRLLTFFFALAGAAALRVCAAESAPPNVTAREVHFDYARNVYVVTGEAHLTDGNALLTADEILYNPDTGDAVATGHVTLTRGPQRLLADQLTYHVRDRSFSASDVRLGEYPLYVSGATASGAKDTVTLTDARASVREPGSFSPTLTANKLIYTAGKTVRAEGATAGVGGVHPLALPKYQQSVHEPAFSYIALTGGYRSSLGVYAEAGLRLPVAPAVKAGADLGLYSSRGILIGPAAEYGSDDGPFRGSFHSGFIHDYGDRRTGLLGRSIPADRGYALWTHQQQATDALTLNAQVNYWSDSEVLRDFHPSWFFPVQEPDTFAEAVYTGENYFGSAFARFHPNSFHNVQERLPELRFDLLPVTVGNGFVQRFNTGVAVLRDAPVANTPTLNSQRFDAYYALSRPFAPRDWFSFTPVVGGRLTHYAEATGGRSTYTRALGEVGFDAALRTSGTFDYHNEKWKIDGLRHLLTPRISYRYVPQADKGQLYIPAIDRDTFNTYLPPLGLGDTRNIDDLRKTNTLRVGLDNTLQTRDPVYGSRDLVTLNTAADFRFDRAPGERELAAIHTELIVSPVAWLQFNLYESFAPDNFTLQQLTTGITLLDGEAWSLQLANHYLQHQTDEYRLQYRLRLNEVYGIAARLQYDARHARFTETAVGLQQTLGNAWLVEYGVTIYAGPRRESSFGFAVRLTPLTF
ncbi:LPS assembly protein LptD [Horticoccus luteus]|uniref:LPS assembly protein LptD n=1 Tax=Horticoccus luteus TaxID=2862869 RepID=A0A8F9TZZ7_9BACT|nr:LPS assembly protein LptD [Horticoccus luteus]QYM80627.1 LPS assembly protein LptD [Horticoccus luteus]